MMTNDNIKEKYPCIISHNIGLHIQPNQAFLSWRSEKPSIQTTGITINSVGAEIIQMINGQNSLKRLVEYFSDK